LAEAEEDVMSMAVMSALWWFRHPRSTGVLGITDSGYDCDCGGRVMVKIVAREPRLKLVGTAVVDIKPERIFCDTCGREFE
jgi:hypothetical protein